MQVNLKDKVVLVTGGSRGIGRETVRLMAKNGATVIVHYHRNRKAAEESFSRLKGQGHMIIKANLSRIEEIEKMKELVINAYGKIDILVNNAAVFDMISLTESNLKEWEKHWKKTIELNLYGPARLSYFVAQQMIKGGGGRIINISSRGAFRGEPEAIAYGASKAGLNSLGQSMAVALAPHKVFVYTVAPGFVETDMSAPALNGPLRNSFLEQSPLKRVATAREVADVILFCASDAPEYMTGCIIDVNGASYLRN